MSWGDIMDLIKLIREEITELMGIEIEKKRLDRNKEYIGNNVDRQSKGKEVIGVIKIYSPNIGTVAFDVGELICEPLKDILKKGKFVAHKGHTETMCLMTYGIKADIRYLDTLTYIINENELSNNELKIADGMTYNPRKDYSIKEVYNIYSEIVKKVDAKKLSEFIECENYIIKSNYQNPILDVNKYKAWRILKEEISVMKELENKYGMGIRDCEYLAKILKKELGIEGDLYSIIYYIEDIYTKYPDNELVGDIKKYRECDRKVRIINSSGIKRNLNRIGNNLTIGTVGLSGINDISKEIISVDRDSYYFVSVDTKYCEYDYYNVKYNELDTRNVNKDIKLAVEVFGVNEEELTEYQVDKANTIMRVRYLKGLENLGEYGNIERLLGDDSNLYSKYTEKNDRLHECTERVIGAIFNSFREIPKKMRLLGIDEDDIVFHSKVNNVFIYKVRRRVNKRKALQLIRDCFNTIEDVDLIDFNVFNRFRCGYNYAEVTPRVGKNSINMCRDDYKDSEEVEDYIDDRYTDYLMYW